MDDRSKLERYITKLKTNGGKKALGGHGVQSEWGHKMVVHYRNTSYRAARLPKIHTNVALVRVIISIFLWSLLSGDLCLANELFYENKMCIVYYSCVHIRSYSSYIHYTSIRCQSAPIIRREDNEEYDPKLCQPSKHHEWECQLQLAKNGKI
jgi:hypothetical protein